MKLMLLAHIVCGSLGLLSGAATLVAAKGGPAHRVLGRVFVASMLLMAATGGWMALRADVRVTVLAASLTAYLVGSGWLAARRARLGAAVWLVPTAGAAIAAYGFNLGLAARAGGRADVLDGGFVVPPTIYFIFATVALLGAATDTWTLARRAPGGRSRIQRHLWRMCAALYIAASSLFSGQEDVFPKALQGTFVLQAPQLLVLALLVFWLARVGVSKRFGPAQGSVQAAE